MRKNKVLIIMVLVFFFLIYLSLNFNIYAFDASDWDPITGVHLEGGEAISNIGGIITGAVKVIGSAVSIITILIIGIKYMMGSVEEKADYKNTMGPYIFGAIMVFGISNVVEILYKLGSSIIK